MIKTSINVILAYKYYVNFIKHQTNDKDKQKCYFSIQVLCKFPLNFKQMIKTSINVILACKYYVNFR